MERSGIEIGTVIGKSEDAQDMTRAAGSLHREERDCLSAYDHAGGLS